MEKKVEIIDYGSVWNVKKGLGKIFLFLKTTPPDKPVTLSNINPADFAAIMSILSTSQECFYTDKGRITTGKEPVDG